MARTSQKKAALTYGLSILAAGLAVIALSFGLGSIEEIQLYLMWYDWAMMAFVLSFWLGVIVTVIGATVVVGAVLMKAKLEADR